MRAEIDNYKLLYNELLELNAYLNEKLLTLTKYFALAYIVNNLKPRKLYRIDKTHSGNKVRNLDCTRNCELLS